MDNKVFSLAFNVETMPQAARELLLNNIVFEDFFLQILKTTLDYYYAPILFFSSFFIIICSE
jgi:hypothetical protein